MKKLFILSLLLISSFNLFAQDSTTFKCKIYNDEHKIYINMNLYSQDILVPDQEILGKLAGYVGSLQCTQVWAIATAKIIDSKTAKITLVNNYGSEDLTCTLKLNNDNTYTLNKEEGSTLKFPVRGKWQKIPGNLTFHK
ncbi:hypothetical protein [Xylanibacter oryzae]|uniref:hypothetical protein n=1 Tax=Xylanibacter oryzae TaxID=185293 RepID=UPI00056096A9|nr:hypothetical protein [Xylanibacter oryzae]